MNKDEKDAGKEKFIDDSQLEAEWEAIMARARKMADENRKANPDPKKQPKSKAG